MNRFVLAVLSLLCMAVFGAMLSPDVEAAMSSGCSGDYATTSCSGEAYGHTGPVRGLFGRQRRVARRESRRAGRHAAYASCGAPASYASCSQPAATSCSQPAAIACENCENCPAAEAQPAGLQ